MDTGLIYDVGAHVGEDTDFYLRKGFSVVAIEANPVLAQRLKQKFQSNISAGRLCLVDAAIAENPGEVDFYVNQANSAWGTIRPDWAGRNAHLGGASKLTRIKAVTFSELLRKYGVPYYLKIDIEGADLLCLEGLVSQSDRPKFVSIESEKRSWKNLVREFEIFKQLGYSRFKIVDQTQIVRQKPLTRATEGVYVEYAHEFGSSGAFGDELPGEWLTARRAIWRYRLIFLSYWLFGDYGVLRWLVRLPGFRRVLKPAPWYDTHAAV